MLRTMRPVHVVAGLGRIGWELCVDLRKNQLKTMVIESDKDNWYIEHADLLGAHTILADARNPQAFDDIPWFWTKYVFFVTGSDEANIRAALNVRERTRPWYWSLRRFLPCSGWQNHIDCYVHVTDPILESQMQSLLKHDKEAIAKIYLFNILQETAKKLILDGFVPHRPSKNRIEQIKGEPVKNGSESRCHEPTDEVALYVIFGFGNMGRSLAIHIAELCHFENLLRPRILVFTANPDLEADKFDARWGRISPKYVHENLADVYFDPKFDKWTANDPALDECYRTKDAGGKFDDRAVDHAANLRFVKFDESTVSLPLVLELQRECGLRNNDGQQIIDRSLAPEQTNAGSSQGSNVNSADCRVLSDAGQLESGCPQQLPGPPEYERKVVPAFVFCFDEDEQNFSQASRFVELWQSTFVDLPPVFAWFPKSAALNKTISEQGAQARIRPFGQCCDIISQHNITSHESEKLASAIMDDYEERIFANSGGKADPERTLRRKQSEENFWNDANLRRSNIMAAIHGQIKLKAIESDPQYRADPLKAKDDPKVVLMLAMMEHNRYVAERLLADWTFMPPDVYFGHRCVERRASPITKHKHNPTDKQRPHICSWEALIEMPDQLTKLKYPGGHSPAANVIEEDLAWAVDELGKDPGKDFGQVEVVSISKARRGQIRSDPKWKYLIYSLIPTENCLKRSSRNCSRRGNRERCGRKRWKRQWRSRLWKGKSRLSPVTMSAGGLSENIGRRRRRNCWKPMIRPMIGTMMDGRGLPPNPTLLW